jgi:hypothetical protein
MVVDAQGKNAMSNFYRKLKDEFEINCEYKEEFFLKVEENSKGTWWKAPEGLLNNR